MSLSNRTCRTASPAQRSLIVTVGESVMANHVNGILPAEGTLITSADWKSIFPRDYHKNFSGFRYVTQLEDTKDGAQLLFARVMTQDERDTPFRTTSKFGNHYWHTILLKLEPIEVDASTDSYVMRETYIPAATEGSRFIIEEFISDVPFSIPKYPTPVASSVSYDVISRRGGFPECLHDKIIIPTITSSNGTTIPKQVFLETNFTTWVPYIISDEQELTQGSYYRKRIRVYPPTTPEAVTRNR